MISFNPIQLWEFASNVGSACVCLAAALVLLFYRTEHTLRMTGFRRLRFYLAMAALLVLPFDGTIIAMVLLGHDFTVLDALVMPVMCYTQFHLASVALLILLRSPRMKNRQRLWFVVPVAALATAHTLGFLLFPHTPTLYDAYRLYIHTPFAQTTSVALFAIVAVELLLYIVALLAEARRYEHGIDSFFSGHKAVEAKILATIVRCFVAYFVLAGLDMVWGNVAGGDTFRVANIVLMWLNTTIFVVATIIVLNLTATYKTVAPAFEQRDRDEQQGNLSVTSDLSISDVTDNPEPAAPAKPHAARSLITPRVEQWSQSPAKPYLRESLTLATAAEEIGISTRLLSAYINQLHQKNFNAWINGLRIEEVKRLLLQQPPLTMSEIAVRTGFTDAPAMSKVFKRFEDRNPSTWRDQNKPQE